MSDKKPSVRRSQVVTTYGPGALMAHGEDSYMVLGIDRWPQPDASDFVPEPRLCAQLRVYHLRQPPTAAEGEHWKQTGAEVPVTRFPLMHTCNNCQDLDYYWKLGETKTNNCRKCGRSLVPARFVVACEHGHIDDFPFSRWVHRGKTPDGQHHSLKLVSTSDSASLRSIRVSCSCGQQRTLEGAFDRHELRAITRCTGKSPWLPDAPRADCDGKVRTLQRGASNIWFSSVRSALSIPPWSDRASRIVDRNWDLLSMGEGTLLEKMVEKLAYQLSDAPGAHLELLRATAARRQEEVNLGTPPTDHQIREQEYAALLDGKAEDATGDEFVAESVPAPRSLSVHFDRIVRASRLREVRALQGFSRLTPATDGSSSPGLAKLAHAPVDWLPAIEVRGEGVFFELATARLDAWERQPSVAARVGALALRAAGAFAVNDDVRPVTPRFVLIHTLAHVLIEQFSLDAGYPAAALRERLYVADDMRGLLIYTATSDSAGSLGGLIAQAEDTRLPDLVAGAISRASWCSTDPVCIETAVSGVDGLNVAACHACALLPETSCEERNIFLDRGLLIGTPNDPMLGYFADLAAAL